jgi:hypothetical protein
VLRRRKSKARPSAGGATPAAYVRPVADVERAAEAMDDVDQRLASTPWWQYRRLDREHRSRTWSTPGWFPDWHLIRPGDVERIADLSGKPVSAAGLLSMHPNGHVREAAVYVLARSQQADALPFVIIRAADWVEQVRRPAKEAVQMLLAEASTEQLLRAAALLDTMTTAEARGSDFSSAARRQIATRFEARELLEAVRHPDVHVRRLAAEVIVERGDAESALDRALEQRDLVTARKIGVAALDQAADLEATMMKLWGSRIASLRALALYRFQSSSSQIAVHASEVGLLDRSPSVRYLAQSYLAKGGVDVRARYIDALESNAIAVHGLAEVGGADDANLIEPLMADPRPRMRVAAVLAIGRLLGPKSRPTMFTMLGDPSPSVVRAAGRVLARQQLTAIELDDLWQRAHEVDAPDAVRRAAFVVFAQQDRWPKLVLSCRAIASRELDSQKHGEMMLRSVLSSWNRSSLDPAAGQLEELRELEETVVERADPNLVRELVALVNGYRSREARD